ncbi:AmmeMemoRadiSam system protein B [Candidatus Parcubacteria bacterium]|nr:MAG: AmmeMemoRadiSam system protein B [Candidatus Parcubacteria bacterium]
MPIVFAAFVPHSPLLIPQIGKQNLVQISKTQAAYQKLSQALKDAQTEVVVIISPHSTVPERGFVINLSPTYTVNFEEFGDFSSYKEFKGEVGLAHHLKERLEGEQILRLMTQSQLDHGAGVPLFLLVSQGIKIIPISISQESLEAHWQFGKLLATELILSNLRIAIIASGDLSHRLTKNAPAPYSPRAKKFDQKVQEYLSSQQYLKITQLDSQLIQEAEECGLRPLIELLGIISGTKHSVRLLSYEYPFGVGYLTAQFEF